MLTLTRTNKAFPVVLCITCEIKLCNFTIVQTSCVKMALASSTFIHDIFMGKGFVLYFFFNELLDRSSPL